MAISAGNVILASFCYTMNEESMFFGDVDCSRNKSGSSAAAAEELKRKSFLAVVVGGIPSRATSADSPRREVNIKHLA